MTRRWLPWHGRPAATPPGGLTCRELVELVTDYLEQALDAGDRARFEDHVAACDRCLAYLEQMRITLALAGDLVPEGLEPETERELLDAFKDWKAGDA